MHTLSKKVSIAVLAVAMTAVCAILGFLIGGQKAVPADSSVPEESLTQIQIKSLPKGAKTTVPTPVRCTKVYLNDDLSAGQDAAAFMQRVAETGFNSVLFLSSRAQPVFADTDECTDALRNAISAARSKGLYSAVRMQCASVDRTAAFIADSGADSLVLSDDANVGELDALLAQTTVSSILSAASPDDVSDDGAATQLLTGYVTAVTEDMSSDTLFRRKQSVGADKLLWFSVPENAPAQQSGYDRIPASLGALNAILETDGAKADTSFVFTSFADFAADAPCMRIVKASLTEHILPDSFRKTFRVTNHSKTSFTTTESKVTFTGECSPMDPLQCNNATIPVTTDGYFSVEYTLQVGKNTFTFTHQGKTVTYQVQYNLDLIRSISPSGKLTTPGGNALEISVVALRKASVYATLNGSRITLTGSDAIQSGTDNDNMDASSDYVTYTGKYNLPESAANTLSLGPIRAFASYEGISDSITGASVTVTAAEKVGTLPVVEEFSTTTTTTTTTTMTTATTAPDVTDLSESEPESDAESESATEKSGSSTTKPIITSVSTTKESTTVNNTTASTAAVKLDPVITPYQNHGLAGTKRMCVVKTYYTETMPLSPLNDLSVPRTTPLLQGTFDFITGESSFDKYTYYNLGSGRRVYRKDVDVIEKGYAMPANAISLVSSGTSGNSTEINLHLKWKVPFNAELMGQNYTNDPKNKREYAVKAFNAHSLDITFYYTSDASGQPNVTGSGVISSCEWVQSASAQTYTLRLHLKNAARFYGYGYSYNADDTLRITIKERASASVSGKTVMLDPGHGGNDGGANCAVNSGTWNEAKVALSLSEKVRSKLQNMGANVLMTRTGNTAVTLADRKKMARQSKPDVFVSIHCDASTSSSAYGTTAFYYRNYSFSLADSIHKQLVSTYKNTFYDSSKQNVDRGTVFYPYSVTRIEECPSVLIEVGYVSNLTECKILQNSQNQDTLAAAIANGIRDYFAQS